MKISCPKNSLVNAMNVAMRAVPKRTVLQVQECVLLEADDGIRVTANDNEIAIQTNMYGMVLEKGAVAIPASLLNDIAKKLPDNDVYIESDENNTVSINCGKSKFKIAGLDGADFTGMPPETEGIDLDMDAKLFNSLISKVIFCTSDNAQQALMTGVHFECVDGILSLVALDGYRIARKVVKVENTADFEATIPARTLSEVSKIFKEGNISISIDKNNVEFYDEDTVMTSRTIYGQFFDVKKVLDADAGGYVLADKAELMDAVNRTTVILKGMDKKPVVVDIQGNVLRVGAKTQLGAADESIDVDQQCDDIKIGFNPRFLLDALAAVDEDEVQINLTNKKSPALISRPDDDYTYVVLPVNI